MPVWIEISFGILVTLVAALFFATRFGTVYWVHRRGYIATSSHQSAIHSIEESQFREVVRRLLPGDRFDMLWVSWTDDRYAGLMVTREFGTPTLRVTFKTAAEQAELKRFVDSMSVLGLSMQEKSDGFNGGMGEAFRFTSLHYSLPESVEGIVTAVDLALTTMSGSAFENYFVSASRYAGLMRHRPGIRFRPVTDPLSQILKDR